MSPVSVIRVLLVRNRLLYREALAVLLESQPDLKVAAHVATVEDAARVIGLTSPIHCAVLEFESGQLDTFCAGLKVLRQHSRILLVGDITRYQELEVLRPMVAGILPNTSNGGTLIEAIRRISSGQTWEDLPFLDGSAALPHTRRGPTFTERQQMVLHLVCEGMSNKQCAHTLGVSPSSIKCTVQQLFLKTKTNSRSQLVRHAMEDLRYIVGQPFPRERPRESMALVRSAGEAAQKLADTG